MASCCSHPPGSAGALAEARPVEWLRLGLAAVVAGQSMIVGMAVNLSPPETATRLWVHGLLAGAAVAVFLLAGLPIARHALGELRRGRIVFEQLFLAGIASAFFASLQATFAGTGNVYYEVVAVLVAIYTLGTVLGERQRARLLQAAERLGSGFSVCTRLTCCGREVETPVAEIAPGDRVRVRAGDGISVDGRLVEGEGLVRESALTGEPYPVFRRAGDRVRAGSHLVDGSLVVEATAAGNARHLDRLLDAVRDARRHPAPIQREADRVVAWFLPAVLAVAAATWLFWVARSGWNTATLHALAVLLVACPCAMGLATPIGIWSALAALARRGLVARDGGLVERLASIDHVVFDKTGTLSDGDLAVVDFVTAPGHDRESLRALAGAIEAHSNHPIALALRGWNQPDSGWVVETIRQIPAAGVEATVRGTGTPRLRVRLGNESVVPAVARSEADRLRSNLHAGATGGSTVFLVIDGEPVGVALLRERLRASVRETFGRLRALGVECEVMTGDQSAALLEGLDLPVSPGLDPAAKEARVRVLVDAGRRVLFVGDGINDAPAMARATASVAMVDAADLAEETAGAVLVSADLTAVPDALRICRTTVATIGSNLRFAAVYNFLGIAMAAAGALHPIAAALVMFGASATVTWRALRHTRRLGVGVPTEAGPGADTLRPEFAPLGATP